MEFVKRSGVKKIVSVEDFHEIVNFISNFQGLTVECEIAILKNEAFAEYSSDTLKHIVEMQCINRLRMNVRKYELKAGIFINEHMQQLLEGTDSRLLLNYAIANGLNPLRLARKVLLRSYHKKTISNMLKYTYLIDNSNLEANLNECLIHDILDGPLVDMRRRFIGEEYEYKLKEFCTKLELCFQDEDELKNLGFDKTPDIRLTLPILYRGKVINWIESKAVFGDLQIHKSYLETQLSSYCNRFGSGMVIYWFGYTEDVPTLDDNMSIIVLHELPQVADLEFLKKL